MPKKTTKKTRKKSSKQVKAIVHSDASRKNLPTAELQSVVSEEVASPIRTAYERRNRDLDPQLVWRGKDEQNESDLIVQAPPLYIQEKIHPKVLVDDLVRRTQQDEAGAPGSQTDLFGDFNGLPAEARSTEFYQHEANWSNRMILGDSLQVMASLAEREGLRGKVQCIYFDPPYGIKFNSNFQWSTTSRDVKDGKADHITREPEQVKAFRDTWRDGIHSYLTYLRDRLAVARDLLAESGSIFVQIGDENVHRVRLVVDEVFGEDNCLSEIVVKKKGGQKGEFLDPVNDFILWYGKNKKESKSRPLYEAFKDESEIARDFRLVDLGRREYSSISRIGKIHNKKNYYSVKPLQIETDFEGAKLFKSENFTGGKPGESQAQLFEYEGQPFNPGIKRGLGWKHSTFSQDGALSGMRRLAVAGRVYVGRDQIGYVRYFSDFGLQPVSNWWDGFGGASNPRYIVQTNTEVVKRCLLLATDAGDLVLDPTCGSGTTAYVAEQWGRRWVTVDTSRVALALARARIMGARYPFYLLADSREGQLKEAEVSQTTQPETLPQLHLSHGFVCHRRNYVTSTVIANNSEIDVLWGKWQQVLEAAREELNSLLGESWQEWEIPRDASDEWSGPAKTAHKSWWDAWTALRTEIDASISAKAGFEYLYDRPYEDRTKVRVAGPFTVESVAPHRGLAVNENDELVEDLAREKLRYEESQDFGAMVLEHLKTSGIQQSKKEDRIEFTGITPWPGTFVSAEGRYLVGKEDRERRAGIFIGPEFGTVSRADLVEAAREAADAGFDSLIACAFSFGAHASEFTKIGRLPIHQAHMNADLHMAEDLKNTGKGNLFVIFGEPDIEIVPAEDEQLQVRIHGVDVFDPSTGEVRSDDTDGIACWFLDTNYNQESFFVRHAYFLGAGDPYKSLKTTLKTEINEEAWASLNSDISRPFPKPETGRIAVKVINHLGDEVMKVFRTA